LQRKILQPLGPEIPMSAGSQQVGSKSAADVELAQQKLQKLEVETAKLCRSIGAGVGILGDSKAMRIRAEALLRNEEVLELARRLLAAEAELARYRASDADKAAAISPGSLVGKFTTEPGPTMPDPNVGVGLESPQVGESF